MLGTRRGTRWSGPLGPAGAGRRGPESLAIGPLPSGPVVVSAPTPACAHDRTRVHRYRSAVRARRCPTKLTGVSERHDPAVRQMHLEGAYEVWPDGRAERAERWEMICPQGGDDG